MLYDIAHIIFTLVLYIEELKANIERVNIMLFFKP